MRISAADWTPGGWDLAQSIQFYRQLSAAGVEQLTAAGVDLFDGSSGGLVSTQQIQPGPRYQVPFAEAIRREAGIATGAVGLITESAQANAIIAGGRADAVLLARAFLRDPSWARHAALALGEESYWPSQYARA